ncbi:MAG: cysteine--tRNA ligase [Deltaproteobacteria bacterium GWA2_55_10]|nr:MAG: cysteine--tRNA ligase [Deltaproteobacteria bacterium GWA2_55_10]
MGIKLFNSLTKTREDFNPATPGKVTMYVCGPTVYDLSHIGHARSAVSFDAIQKYLRYRGYEVKYARNYTDVDDKIIKKANQEGATSEVIAERYIKAFDEDMAALNVGLPDIRPRATESIDKIIEVTKRLIENGYAYAVDGDVYYSVRKKKDYGKLSGKNIDDLESGARVEVDERKSDPLDFALWKASKPGEPWWESPWGKGRPGWHIECSAMVMEWLGDSIDIHGGGKDLIFPHHENEIAQSEAATGKAPYVRYWLHNGFVNIEKEKMSKSLGNILNIRDALREHTAEAIRLFLLSSHYRSPIDYTAESLRESESAVERFYKTLQRASEEFPTVLEAELCVQCVGDRLNVAFEPMDDDFNTAEVIGNLFKEITRMNKAMDEAKATGERRGVWEDISGSLAVIREASKFLGIFNKAPVEYFSDRNSRATVKPEEIERLIAERNAARKKKDFARADAIRKELLDKGIVLEDTAKGTLWSVKG